MKGKTIFALVYDDNVEDFSFFKVTIPAPFPNQEHCYHTRDFIINFISGNKTIFNDVMISFKNTSWNGYCTALKTFALEDFYMTSRYAAWDFYSQDYDEIRANPKKYPYVQYNKYPTFRKQKKIYEILCTEDYFKNQNVGCHKRIMVSLFKKFKLEMEAKDAAEELEKILSTF